MTDSTQMDQQPARPENTPRRKRRWGKLGAVVLLLGCAGTVGAYHFLKADLDPPPAPVEYQSPDIGQATEKVKEAETKVAQDQQTLQAVQKSVEEIQAEWELTVKAIEEAKAKVKSASGDELAEARESLEGAVQRLSQLKQKLEFAKAELREAESRLENQQAKKEEAEENQKEIQDQLAKQEAQRQALLGKWKWTPDYGEMQLELNEDGKGVMTIDFNTAAYFVVGSKTLEVDIEWRVAPDDHLIFNSLRGRPEKAFHFVTVTLKRGTHRDQVLTSLKRDTFTAYDVGEEDDIKTWTRIKETPPEK